MNKRLKKTLNHMLSLIEDDENVFTITYKGQGVSLNQFYDSSHWTKRNKLKKTYRPLFRELANKVFNGKTMDQYGLVMYYNSRHDPDNVVGTEKLFIDALCESHEGCVVKDDSSKHFKFVSIIPDKTLDKNTFEFNLIKIK